MTATVIILPVRDQEAYEAEYKRQLGVDPQIRRIAATLSPPIVAVILGDPMESRS